MNKTLAFPSRQRGVVFITTVMLLIVMTLLVISLMRTSILEERMIGYSRDWNMAFQAAETALRDAEREIKTGSRVVGQTGFVSGCSTTSGTFGAGLCLQNLCTDKSATGDCLPIWVHLDKVQNDAGWKTGTNSGKSIQYGAKTGASALPGVAAQPRYIIEVMAVPDASSLKPPPGMPAQKYLYRATAVGFGANIQTRVMLQGTYRQY